MISARCVVIGGGTGSFSVLSGLKHSVSDISALVSMTDDGGSTGMLRDDMGVLPPGDVRKCLVALSDASEELRELFNYRYDEGALKGHSFGNLFLSTIEKMTHNFGDAVRITSDILRIHGRVLPITLDDVRLVGKWTDGTRVVGEGEIDTMHFATAKGRPDLSVTPRAVINPEARQALLDADMVIIAPGDIYTSLGALLIVDGVAEALAQTNATVMYICNLVIKPGQTDGFTIADHAAEIERFAGGPILDYVVYNTAEPSEELKRRYADHGELLLEPLPDEFADKHYRAVGYPLIATDMPAAQKGDALAATRSFIRHDSQALAAAIADLYTTK